MTAHACARRHLFRTATDFKCFLTMLATVCERRGWWLRTYCLLHTHYHLMVDTPHGDIAAGMQSLNARFAEWMNAVLEEKGHLFRSRYGSVLVQRESHFWEVQRYIALNPVRAGVCDRPEDWRWSGYPELLGMRPARRFMQVDRTLRSFGATPDVARARLSVFVEDGVRLADRSDEAA